MNRSEFEALRDLPGKKIPEDIKFSRGRPNSPTSPWVVAEGVRIENGEGVDARLLLRYNPETGAKTCNVHIPGVGAICRLDVDGHNHAPAGRSHKHSLETERCPDRHLHRDVKSRPDLSGKTMKEVFEEFCVIAEIEHTGTFEEPEG